MAVTASEIAAFHDFALEQLRIESPNSLESLVDAWRILHPAPLENAENIAAIRAALRDMEDGDIGRPANHVVRELRLELASTTKK